MLYLKDIEPEAAAAIACKVTFDKVFSPKPKSNLVQNVTDAIGQAIENECMMRYYERNVPGLAAYYQRELLPQVIGTHQKVKVVTTLMNVMMLNTGNVGVLPTARQTWWLVVGLHLRVSNWFMTRCAGRDARPQLCGAYT